MVDIHEDMIAEREAKIRKSEANIDVWKAEIKVLREAQALTNGESPIKKKSPGKRERALSAKWADVLGFMGVMGEVSYKEMAEYAEDNGHNITDGSLRAQMITYIDNGLVARVKDGIFSLTEKGKEKCDFSEKNEAPEGASIVGEDATLPNFNQPAPTRVSDWSGGNKQ